MRVHTKKHHTENQKPASFYIKKEESINWREAVKEAYGNLSINSISLKGMRNREGWTQVELAAKIGVSQANLSKMENGKRPIGKKIAHRLAEVFETDYRVFL